MTDEERKIMNAYLKRKLSDSQIAKLFRVRRARVRWVLSKYKVPKRTISEAIRYLYITKFGKEPFSLRTKLTPSQQQLKLAATMLYWGEGTKKGSTVALSNSDPLMVKIFVKFLRDICGVHEDRLRVGLHYYEDQNPLYLKRFWSKIAGIPASQFDHPFLHKRVAGTYTTRSVYGTVAVRYSDKELLKTINRWITEYQTTLSTGS